MTATSHSDSMPSHSTVRVDNLATESPAAFDAERHLEARGIPIPFSSRPTVLRYLRRHETNLLVARDERAEPIALIAVASPASRAMPGHRTMRVEAVSDSLASDAGFALLREAQRLAQSRSTVLRLVVELECRSDASRASLAGELSKLGFEQIPCDRIPDRTLVTDLSLSEDAILAGFGRSTRQNVRAAAKHDLQLVALDDANYGPRMNTLLAESFSRTGGEVELVDWRAVLQLCAAAPNRSRLVGAFRGASRGPDDLVGFAWGLHHGDRVQYHTGASARIQGIRLPILYPVLWDLIVWGKQSGGTWFDFGGVTPGTAGSDDALGGISAFKRGFSKDEVASGQEWAFTPSPIRWRLAQQSSRLARWLRGLRKST